RGWNLPKIPISALWRSRRIYIPKFHDILRIIEFLSKLYEMYTVKIFNPKEALTNF
ncbi:1101_t:CDS:1, partial [Funneliformis caledonium]